MMRLMVMHFAALNDALDGCLDVSICGQDASKIGTDLGLTVAVVLNQESGECGVGPAQVLVVHASLLHQI